MRYINYSLLLLFLSLNACTSCKNKDCTGVLQFDLPLQAYGIKDTLYLGDTLRIELEIPERLAERNSGVMYDFIDYNFKLITYMAKIDTLPTGIDTKGTFDWITTQGESIYSSLGAYAVNPEYINSIYHYNVVVIPKHKGLYVFGMNSVFFSASPLQKLDGPCSKNWVEVYMKLTNDDNVNFEFLRNSPDPSQANTDRQRFDEFAGFCFYVK